MAIQISNQARLTYTYGDSNGTAASNIATTTLEGPLSARKRVLEDGYRADEALTYTLGIGNTGAAPLTNVTVTDDLGAYTPQDGTAQVQPLTYVGPAELYLNGVFSTELTPVVTAEGVTFSIPTVPADGTALILYRAAVNANAPLEAGSTVENTATVSAAGISEPITASASVDAADYADVQILKSMSPDPVTEGSVLTYTFTIYNYGNTTAENVILTDDFDPAPTNITVTVNGAAVPATDYSYVNGELILPAAGSALELTVPAAAFARDPETGALLTDPGIVTVTVSGTI